MEQKLQNLINSFSPETIITIDTPFLIYHLEDVKPYSEITTVILDNIGKNNSMINLSLISYSEILVGVFKSLDPEFEKQYRFFFGNNPYINIVDFKFELAEQAAKVRMETDLGLADSIIIATALKMKSECLISNDKGMLKARDLGVSIVLLEELIK